MDEAELSENIISEEKKLAGLQAQLAEIDAAREALLTSIKLTFEEISKLKQTWVERTGSPYGGSMLQGFEAVQYDFGKLPNDKPTLLAAVKEFYLAKAKVVNYFIEPNKQKTPSSADIYKQVTTNIDSPNLGMTNRISQIIGRNNTGITALSFDAVQICASWLSNKRNYTDDQVEDFWNDIYKFDNAKKAIRELLPKTQGLPKEYQLNAVVNGVETKRTGKE